MVQFVKKKNKNKGITLIALVVTIIVLLILAAVAIQMLTGDNGILKKAGEAKENNERAQIKEEIVLAWNGVQTNGIPNRWNNETKTEALQTELQKEDSSATATLNEQNINVQYKGYETTINVMNGSITELAKVNGPIGESEMERLMRTATKHPNQTASDDIGIDAYGKIINLDLWEYEEENDGYTLINPLGSSNDGSEACYLPLINDWETSKWYTPNINKDYVVCPQYIKKAGTNIYKEVISLRYYCFSNTSIKKIVLSNTIRDVDLKAFEACQNLKSITFGKECYSINNKVFDYCNQLHEICLDSSTLVEKIYEGTFSYVANCPIDTVLIKQELYDESKDTISINNKTLYFKSIVNGYAVYMEGADSVYNPQDDFGEYDAGNDSIYYPIYDPNYGQEDDNDGSEGSEGSEG